MYLTLTETKAVLHEDYRSGSYEAIFDGPVHNFSPARRYTHVVVHSDGTPETTFKGDAVIRCKESAKHAVNEMTWYGGEPKLLKVERE